MVISSCSVNEAKVGILPIMASYSRNLFQSYFKGAKIWWLFAQLYKLPADYLFRVESLDRMGVDFKIVISSIASQEKENKILCIANEEMGATSFNSP